MDKVLTEDQLLNYKRNRLLIDFDYIPKDIIEQIVNAYEEIVPSPRKNIYTYMVERRLVSLLEHIGDF